MTQVASAPQFSWRLMSQYRNTVPALNDRSPAKPTTTATTMIDLCAFHALAHAQLGPFAAKPTSLEVGQQEASKPLWSSPDGRVAIGIWECTPGRFTADRTKASEFCHFISGTVEMTHADGSKVLLGPGDAIHLPLGWTGTWHVLTQVRKLYVITQG